MISADKKRAREATLEIPAEAVVGEVFGYEHVELLPGAPYRVFMHGSVAIPLHWHSEIEIIVVLAGEVGFMVAGQLCRMRAGDVMIINQNAVHNSTAWTPDALVCGIHIAAEHYEAMGLPGFASREYLCRSFLHGRHFRTVADPIRSIVARLVIHEEDGRGEAFLHRWLADALCYFIYRRVPWDKRRAELDARSNSGRDRILHVMRRVRNEPGEEVSLRELADESGVSLSHLSRNFKAYVGLGFQDYIINLRLDRALRRIRTSGAPISEIANQTGFTNSTLFFAKFRERFGCTPAEFRAGSDRPAGSTIPASTDDMSAARLLLTAAAELHALGELGTIAAPRGRFRLSAPHGLGNEKPISAPQIPPDVW